MIDIFDRNCAMVSKTGVSDQCSALNGKFNPKADARKKLMEIRMAREAESANRQKLLDLRFNLCSSINLLQTEGKDLHEVFFKLGNMVNEAYVETNKTNINRVMSDLRELNNEEPRSKLRGICVRIGSSKAAKYTKPSSPEQAPRYSGSPNKAKLTEGPIKKLLIQLTLPMIAGMISMTIFNLTDTFFIGQLGKNELAAMSFTFPIVMILNSIALGLGMGASSVM